MTHLYNRLNRPVPQHPHHHILHHYNAKSLSYHATFISHYTLSISLTLHLFYNIVPSLRENTLTSLHIKINDIPYDARYACIALIPHNITLIQCHITCIKSHYIMSVSCTSQPYHAHFYITPSFISLRIEVTHISPISHPYHATSL